MNDIGIVAGIIFLLFGTAYLIMVIKQLMNIKKALKEIKNKLVQNPYLSESEKLKAYDVYQEAMEDINKSNVKKARNKLRILESYLNRDD
ncbi:MAG: hypothetical protein ACOC2U_04045 [bacterium]